MQARRTYVATKRDPVRVCYPCITNLVPQSLGGSHLFPGAPEYAHSSRAFAILSPLASHTSHNRLVCSLPLNRTWDILRLSSPLGLPPHFLALEDPNQGWGSRSGSRCIISSSPHGPLSAHLLDTLMTQVLRVLYQEGTPKVTVWWYTWFSSHYGWGTICQRFCSRSTQILCKYLYHPIFHKARLSEKKNW